MLRVDFYILTENTLDARLLAVCKLTNKALANGHRVYIQLESEKNKKTKKKEKTEKKKKK